MTHDYFDLCQKRLEQADSKLKGDKDILQK